MTVAVQTFLLEKSTIGRDKNYDRAMRVKLEVLAVSLGSNQDNWTFNNAKKWALELNSAFKPITVKNYIKTANTFCRWCVEQNYLYENCFEKVPTPEIICPEVEFLKVEELRTLLNTARDQYPKAVAYFALGAFAGIRSSACARLEFDSIDFENHGIAIKAEHAKNKRRVYLDSHEPNLWKWLEWAKANAPEGFNLTKRQWDDIRGKVATAAKVKMPHNALRHSFCTYHVALHGDAGKTATLLTHKGNVSILYEHYKGNANNADAHTCPR